MVIGYQKRIVQQVKGSLTAYLADLFQPPVRIKFNYWVWIWLLGLYVGGAIVWLNFFNFGNYPYNFHDWAVIAMPRLFFLKAALAQGVIPLHISNAGSLAGVTDRYLAVPNTIFSPQILLLNFMDVGHYVVVSYLLWYTIGFLGMLALRRRFGLSVFTFSVLFSLFEFNGHIVAHMSVGHLSWETYYLYPWFALLVFNLLDGDHSWRWVAGMSCLMFFAFLQGAFHQVLWMSIFVGLAALPSWRRVIAVAKVGFFAGLLSLFRLLPAILLVHKFEDSYQFMSGYPNLAVFWQSLTSVQNASVYINTPAVYMQTGFWEFDLYIGYIGLAFMLFFGGWMWIRRFRHDRRYLPLLLPIIVLAILSTNGVFKTLHDTGFVLFAGERVSSRWLILPFLFMLFVAVIELQRWIERTPLLALGRIALIELVIANGIELGLNLQAWTVAKSSTYFPALVLDPSTWQVANRPDPAYLRALDFGMLGALVGAVGLLVLVWLENRRRATLAVLAIEPPPGAPWAWRMPGSEFHRAHIAHEIKRLNVGELQPAYVERRVSDGRSREGMPK